MAKDFLLTPVEARSAQQVDGLVANADVVMSLCSFLRDQVNNSPVEVGKEASALYAHLLDRRVGLFDERYFLLGEAALTAGCGSRLQGHREETERWLDRAEASFRHTLNPAPLLARVSYIRLTLRYDTNRFDDVLELLPSVALTFEKCGMSSELAKCRFLEANTLKALHRNAEALARFESLASGQDFEEETAIRGMALVSLGDLHSERGDIKLALDCYRLAQPLLETSKRLAALADLKAVVGETLRRIGKPAAAIQAFREAVRDHESLGMSSRAVYLRVLLAELLLEAARPREAEWEILAALPTIDQERMVPEGFAAVALLQESVRRRKTDPRALGELREYLQAKN
jgi:tetratricopeptide (TPR) repeat protein